jgi:uncharacterized iron-regulated protein
MLIKKATQTATLSLLSVLTLMSSFSAFAVVDKKSVAEHYTNIAHAVFEDALITAKQ